VIGVRRPSDAAIAAHVAAQAGVPLTYTEIGATRDAHEPPGFDHDHNRARLGSGADVFGRARDAIRAWAMFPAPLATIVPHAPIREGEVVGVVIHALGLWWLNAARIVYVIDEPRRFGFAYGTTPGHVECGEERFLVEWLDDDSVWYDLRAFSRPRFWMTRVGKPLTRRLQRRFAMMSKAAMVAAVHTVDHDRSASAPG
jgi:uncharacterized protein (UPF0548 family)